MTDFSKILDTKLDEIEKPALPPAGNYIFTVTRQPETDSIADGKYDVIDFQCQALQAIDDVEFPEGMKLTDVKQRLRFMFPTDAEEKVNFDRSMNRLKRFLENTLCIEDADKLSIKEALALAPNHQFIGTIGWRQDKNDPETYYAEINKTAPTED